jgi:choline-glycine betaine transporter
MTSDGNENPSNAVKAIWGVLIAAITAVLIISSGLEGLQSVALIAALPFTVIMILISISLFKSMYSEQKAEKQDHVNITTQRKAQ